MRSAAQGADPGVDIALPDDGPSGILWGHIWITDGEGDGGYGPIAW